MNSFKIFCHWLGAGPTSIDALVDNGKLVLVACPFIGPYEGKPNKCLSKQKPDNREICYVLQCAQIQEVDNPPPTEKK